MEDYPDSPKSVRSRKRQSEDEELTTEELKKKKKNADAAKKCRERKQQQTDQLKTDNAKLEAENMELSKKKLHLEADVQKLQKIINDHVKRGCQLPEHVRAILDDIDSRSAESPGLQYHNPASLSPLPSRPESTGSLIPPSPRALFSGEPVEDLDRNKKTFFNGQNFVTKSPEHKTESYTQQMLPGNGDSKPVQEVQQILLKDFISKSSSIPRSHPLAPISSRSTVRIDKGGISQGQNQGHYSSRQINVNTSSTHVNNMKDSNSHTQNYSSHEINASIPSVVYDNDADEPSVPSMTVNDLMLRALRNSRDEPDIELETHNYSVYENQVSQTGFVGGTPSPIQAHSSSHRYHEVPQTVPVSNNQIGDIQRSQKSTPPPSVNGSLHMSTAELLAPALLSISPSEMNQTLQQQIRCNFSNSPCSSTVPITSSLPLSSSSGQSSVPLKVEGNESSYGVTQGDMCSQSQTRIHFMHQPQQATQTTEFHTAQRQVALESQDLNRPLVIKKNGQILILKPLASGKHRVHHLTDGKLVDTFQEFDLRRNGSSV